MIEVTRTMKIERGRETLRTKNVEVDHTDEIHKEERARKRNGGQRNTHAQRKEIRCSRRKRMRGIKWTGNEDAGYKEGKRERMKNNKCSPAKSAEKP